MPECMCIYVRNVYFTFILECSPFINIEELKICICEDVRININVFILIEVSLTNMIVLLILYRMGIPEKYKK